MKNVDALMRRAIVERVFPGAVLLVAMPKGIDFFQAYGVENLQTQRPVRRETVFDLASLTKPLATTLAVMKLVELGRLSVDQDLGDLLPQFNRTDKARVTLRHLLTHTSGLPDYRPYYKTLRKVAMQSRRDAHRQLLTAEPLVHPIGERTLYSDIGFMILAWVVEEISEIRLDRFLREYIYLPLGIEGLFFNDLNRSKSGRVENRTGVAATEDCPWRSKLLIGEVHDDNAYVVGGIDGHAGLFGDAGSVYALLDALMKCYQGQGADPVFRGDLVKCFLTPDRTAGRALGFDIPSSKDSSSGHYFSKNTVGHLGFTGTSFWMDLEKGIMVILLSNRVHPTRENERIRSFRPALHDAVMINI